MSGTFDWLFENAASAASIAYNRLGSLFNLAGLPPVSPAFTPIAGLKEQSRLSFIESLQEKFLSKFVNTPSAQFGFHEYFVRQPESSITPMQAFFSRLVAFVNSENEPFYRVRESVEYILSQYPQGFEVVNSSELFDLLQQYENWVFQSQDKDTLFENFKAQFQFRVETPTIERWLGVVPFESSGDLVRLDTELETYLSTYFPQLDYLFSDECQRFLSSHLIHLRKEDAATFCKGLSCYLDKLLEDLNNHVNYEDKISDVFLETRNQIARVKIELENRLKALIQPSSDLLQLNISQRNTSKINSFWMSLISLSSSLSKSNITNRGVISVGVFLLQVTATKSQGTIRNLQSAPFATPLNISVGSALSYYVNSYYNCGTFPNSTTILACPSSSFSLIDISTLTPPYPPATWLSRLGMTLIGTPKITDRFWQGYLLYLQRYTCPSNFNAVYSLCPTMEQLSVRFTFWIPDTPPYILTSNTTKPYENITIGAQPCIGATRNGINQPFSCNLLQEGVGDSEGDPSAFGLYLPSQNHGPSASGHTKPPSRITIDTVTGDISFVPTAGDEGRWFFDLFVYNTVWNLKPNVYDYNFNLVTWQSFFWTTSYIDIPNAAPLFSPLLSDKYSVTPGNTLTIGFAGVFKDPNSNSLSYFLQGAGNETLSNLLIDGVRQLISFSPSTDQRTRDSGPYRITLTACNNPGSNCGEITGCIPAQPACTDAPAFDIEVQDNPLILNPNQPFPSASSTTIGNPISLSNAANLFVSPDQDPLSVASATQVDTNNPLSSDSITLTSSGQVTVKFQPGAQTGVPYSIKLTATNNRGAYISGLWTISLTPRPTQLRPGLPTNIASIAMQSPGSTVYPFPFSNPDLLLSTATQTLQTQTTITIPEALTPYLQVTFNNTTGFNFNWTGVPGLPGTWPIVFTQTDPFTAQQISATTNLVINNAGPYLISATSLQTGLIGSSVNFNLISHFGHLDNAATLTYSIALPNGLRISNGQILGTIQTKTAGVYDPPITVTDNMGKTLLPLPTLSLTIPATTPTLINPGTLTAVINSGSSIPTLSSQFQVINPDQNNYQVSKVGSNPPMLTVNSDGSYFLTPQNTQQGNYTAVIQITNGIGTTQINVPIVISRASLQLPSFVPTLQAFIAQLVQLDACTLVNDADNPGSCSNFDLSWSLPSELKASNTTAASASTMGSLLSLNAAFNSEVQGTYTAALTLRDLRSTHTYQVQIPIQFLNKAPKAAVSLQTLLNQNSQSTFTVPDPVFTDPDGDNLSVMASVPTRCTRDPIQKQTTCTTLTPAIYDLVYTATDSSMTNATSTVRIPINPAPVTNIFIELFSKAGPGVLLPVATAMLFLAKYWFWDRPKTAALNKLEKTLKPMVILLEQVHKKYKWLPMESHPLGLPHTHGSTPKPTPEAAPAIDFTPAASTPVSFDTGIGVGLLAEAKCIPSPPSSHALVKRHSITPGITHSRDSVLAIRRTRLGDRAVEISNQLTTAILNVTDSESSIETFQALFGEYLGCLDEYHATGSRDVTSECNVMTVLTALSNRFDKSLGGITREKSGLHITPRIKALIDWLEKLSTRFVSYHSGSIIDLAEKFNLAQAITDCIKAVRQHLKPKKSITPSDHPQELEQEQETIGEQRALLATQELLRGMITSVKDDDEASIRRTFTCSRREVKSETRTLHKKILIPKMWIAPAMFFRNISQIGTSHPDNLEIFKMLNKVVSGINVHQPTRVNFWQVCTQKPLKIKFLGKECTFSPLSPSQASRANYWAWDAYMALMDNWSPASQFEAKIENEKMACLAEGLKNLLGLPLKDKLGEDKIRSFVLTRLGQSLQNFLVNPGNQLTVKQATSLLLKLSPYFSDPQINQMVTDYVLAISKQTSHDKTTNNKLAAFCREFKAQYAIASESNQSKIKELRAWLDSAPREIKEIREIAQLKSELILTTHRWSLPSFSSFRSNGSNGSSSPRSASPHGTTITSIHRRPKPTSLDSMGAHVMVNIGNPLPSATTRMATVIRHQAPMAPEGAIPKRGDRAGRTSFLMGNKEKIPGTIEETMKSLVE